MQFIINLKYLLSYWKFFNKI